MVNAKPSITRLQDPKIIYESSSYPKSGWNKNLEETLREVIKYSNSVKEASILEIGANDGELAKKLIKEGVKEYTIVDPSLNSKEIKDEKINLINDYFGSEVVENTLGKRKYDIIIGLNVFSHISNLHECINSIHKKLKPNGHFLIEFQSEEMIKSKNIDYVYHEHIFYHTATSIETILKESSLEIVEITKINAKGGSLRVIARKEVNQDTYVPELTRLKKEEEIHGIHSVNTWSEMIKQIEEMNFEIKRKMQKVKGLKPIIGTEHVTGTSLTTLLGIEKDLDWIVDDNKQKIGRYTPNAGKEIKSTNEIPEGALIVCLAWRYLANYEAKLKMFDLVVPVVGYNRDD